MNIGQWGIVYAGHANQSKANDFFSCIDEIAWAALVGSVVYAPLSFSEGATLEGD